jgi:uncharacterized membrane protein YgcG
MKRIFNILFIAIILLTCINVEASTKTYERNASNNYGINKKYNIDEEMLYYIKQTKYVDASEKIYDFSDILTDEEEAELYKKVNTFIEHTNMDMVILTDSVIYVNDDTNDNYALDFYDFNDFGITYDKYDGVILFRNTYEYDPYYGSYMTGRAQLYFTDSRNDQVLDDIYDYFRNREYYEGISLYIDEMTKYYDKGIPSEYKNAYLDENGYVVVPKTFKPPFIVSGIVSTIVTLITMIVMVKKNKMVYKAKTANEYLDKETIKYNRKDSRLASSNTVRHYNPPSSSSSGGGSFGGHSVSGHSGGGRHG